MVASLLVAFVVILLTFIIYKIAYKNFDHWKKKNVPGPEPIPFFGNYAYNILLREHLGSAVQRIYNQFPKEKYVGVFFGNIPALLIRDPNLIKLIMTRDFFYFNSRGFEFDIKREPLNANVFSTSGDIWRLLRHNLTPLFSSAKMRNMFYLVAQCEQEFAKFTHKCVAAGPEVEVRDLMSRFSMDIIGSCAFGLQMHSMIEENTTFRKMGHKIFATSISRSIKFFIRLFAPFIFNLFNLRTNDPILDEFFIELSQKTMESRAGKPSVRHDFIDLLAELKQKGHLTGDSILSMKPGAGKNTVSLELNEKLLAAQSFIFFAAGFETSSTTTSYVLYELAKHPHIQQRVHEEIDILLNKYDGSISYEMLKEANYLNMVMEETMRLYPVLFTITRKCTSRYMLPDGKVVEEGVRIHLPVYALHHDPQYYPDPETFDPERFTPEMKQARNQFTYMPFGEGHRICIGLRFGKMQVLVGLISLLRDYTISPSDRTPSTLKFDPKAFVTAPTTGIWLKLTPRIR